MSVRTSDWLQVVTRVWQWQVDCLFNKVLDNPYHVLHNSMPNETVSSYALKRRPHNRELVNKTSRLVESSFIVRMLYKDIY